MFRLACSILGRSDEAEDMMQDVAEKILRRQEKTHASTESDETNIRAILPIGLSAQRSELDGIFDEYAGRKEYQSVIYGKTMLGNMVHAIVKKQYERISMVSGDGRVSQFYLYDPDSAKKDMSFVMTIEGEGESVVMEIIGRFDVKDITRLSSIGRKE